MTLPWSVGFDARRVCIIAVNWLLYLLHPITIKHFIWLLRNDRYEYNCLMTFNLIMYIKDSWSTAQIIWQYTKHWSCHGCHGFLLLIAPVVVLTTTCGAVGGGVVGTVTALVGLQNILSGNTQIAKLMGPTWGPPGSWRPQMGPMLDPWTLLSR